MKHHIATPFAMPENPSRRRPVAPLALVVIACAVLAACSTPRDPLTNKTSESKLNPANWLTPYRIDVIQGNFISKEQVELLRAGMIREQVKATLGTPLITSLFHADRWDYVFTLQRKGVPAQSYRYTVFFKGDVLDRFEGDAMPSENEFIAQLDSKRKLGKVPVLEATEEQLNKAAERRTQRGDAVPSPLPAPPAGSAPTTYPPLESSPQ
jgi:outer membrane protein assembly factor BamE